MKCFQLFAIVLLFGVCLAKNYNYKSPLGLDITPRITNGQRANTGQFPWHVSLVVQYRNDNTNALTFCGGVILNELWILAAADCVFNARTIRADIGSVNINRPDLHLYPDTFIIHPQYNPNRFRNNLALLRLPLNRPIRFPQGPNPNYWPIRLPTLRQQNQTFEDEEAYFTGFGYNAPNSRNVSEYLAYTEQRIISNRACLGFYDNDNQLISPQVICTHSVNAREGACNGDGGAPLVINEYGAWTLIGSLSFLHARGSCGRQPAPGAFTRITSHFDWIHRTAGYQFRP